MGVQVWEAQRALRLFWKYNAASLNGDQLGSGKYLS